MKRHPRSVAEQPTALAYHVREIQLRLLAIVAVLLGGMIVGYFFYEPLFAFIKAPLNGPLHYMSPAGSFTFIIKICMMVGIIAALPVAIYNIIMFIQPALSRRLSHLRVYLTTLTSLLLAGGGAAFGYFIILPLALRFFYKFQVEGLEAIISADEYLRFVIGIIITFVLIFQLPLLISLADHIRPLPPRKLLKAEKYIIVGSVFIGVVVPFALDPTVQLLIASPIIILYNLSVGIVLLQQFVRKRHKKPEEIKEQDSAATAAVPPLPLEPAPMSIPPVAHIPKSPPASPIHIQRPRPVDGISRGRRSLSPVVPSRPEFRLTPRNKPPIPPTKSIIMDIHPIPAQRRPSVITPDPATN